MSLFTSLKTDKDQSKVHHSEYIKTQDTPAEPAATPAEPAKPADTKAE